MHACTMLLVESATDSTGLLIAIKLLKKYRPFNTNRSAKQTKIFCPNEMKLSVKTKYARLVE